MTYEIKIENGKTNVYHDGTKEFCAPEVLERLHGLGYRNIASAKWAEMLRDLLTPGGTIITRMRATAKTSVSMSVEFTTLLIVMQNGVNGFPDEPTLQTLLRMNWGFTSGEKATINTYLTNNNFNISVL